MTPVTEDWLKENGFKWHQLERQPSKHWLLWLGDAVRGNECPSFTSYEDIGIEVAAGLREDELYWFCWLRSDAAGRYHRFIHLRHIRFVEELAAICEAIAGQAWSADNNYAGSMRTPAQMENIRREHERFDRVLIREGAKWSLIEKDRTRGGALPEHLEAHATAMGQL